MRAPKVKIMDMSFDESHFIKGTKKWFAKTLYNEVKKEKLQPFDFPLATFDMSTVSFESENMENFLFQCKRVLNADKTIPIVFDASGQVADGYHRICKAILDGDRYIKAYRLNIMPKEDETIEEEEV